jgi:hypothetical protein
MVWHMQELIHVCIRRPEILPYNLKQAYFFHFRALYRTVQNSLCNLEEESCEHCYGHGASRYTVALCQQFLPI